MGALITIVLEWHTTVFVDRCRSAEHILLVPVIGTGLLPLPQGLLLPPRIV